MQDTKLFVCESWDKIGLLLSATEMRQFHKGALAYGTS